MSRWLVYHPESDDLFEVFTEAELHGFLVDGDGMCVDVTGIQNHEQEFKNRNARKSTTAENTAKGEKTMNTTQITISFQGAPTPQQIAAQLRFQAGLLEGMEPKAAASRKNTDGAVSTATASTATSEAEGEDDDFGGKSAKKTTAKKGATKAAASFDDEDETTEEPEAQESEEQTESEDDGDFMDAAPAKKETKAKKVTVNEVNDACKAKAKASDRKTVLAILKKKFGVTSVTELDQKQYADVIKAMA